MKNINKAFKNAVLDMSREELLHYVNTILLPWELITALLKLDEDRKVQILNEETEKAMSEIFGKLEKLSETVGDYQKGEAKKKHLEQLEGRMLLLLLTMRLAKNSGDQKLLRETSVNFHELNIEYRSDGGQKQFKEENL